MASQQDFFSPGQMPNAQPDHEYYGPRSLLL